MKGPAALLACLLGAGSALADGLDRAVGKALFERLWVPAPASTGATDGLGPFHDARSCAACHPGGAGAARLHVEGDGSLGGLGLTLRRVGSGTRRTFVEGERDLSRWMEQHAFVSWAVRQRPWELEDELIATVDLPLNLDGNRRNAFHAELSQIRARCVAQANALPILPNPGVGGR